MCVASNIIQKCFICREIIGFIGIESGTQAGSFLQEIYNDMVSANGTTASPSFKGGGPITPINNLSLTKKSFHNVTRF